MSQWMSQRENRGIIGLQVSLPNAIKDVGPINVNESLVPFSSGPKIGAGMASVRTILSTPTLI